MSTNSMNFKNCLGIELGSTRIKAVLIDNHFNTVSSGDYTWKSSYENKIWTYSLDEVWKGLNAALEGHNLSSVNAIGMSAILHLTKTGIYLFRSVHGRTQSQEKLLTSLQNSLISIFLRDGA